ncbi:MAG: DUF2169 domain-containing protein [Polyangiaceae bacterium]|nr:DUF2169 domain-containing protein [Polyangiaceae bacterium]
MLIKNQTPFAFGTAKTSRRPPQPEMVLIVRAKLRIEPGAVASVVEGLPPLAQGSLSSEVFGEEDDDHAGECTYPDDFAQWKLHAEVMLRGTCHVPNGHAVPECPVRFSVGDWTKILRVVGPRVWSDDDPTRPVPFTEMPMSYSHAFGGAGYPQNPIGRGFNTTEVHNIEGADEVTRSRGDRPVPAGFGPLSANWPPRSGKLGKGKNPKGRVFFPEDFDWSFFQSAPSDQQLRGYLRGDEEVVFQNLHPSHQVLTTRLPGTRVRAFVNDIRSKFREVKMNLDTLFAEVDQGFIYLTWRGVEPVSDFDLRDVKSVLFASEDASEAPRSVDHYRASLEAFERDPRSLDNALPPNLLSDAEKREIERNIAAANAAKEASAQSAGGAPDPSGLPPDIAAKLKAFDPKTQERMAQSLSALMARAAKQGVDLSAHLAAALDRTKPAPPAPGGGKSPASGSPAGLKATMAQLSTRMESLRSQAGETGHPHSAEFAEYDRRKNDPKLKAVGLDGSADASTEPGPGKDLSGADLTGHDLGGRDLTGANLERALLTKASLKGAKLTGAKMKGAIMSEADLSGADLAEADLTEALLEKAVARGASLRGATLTRTIFHETDLTGADLTGAKGSTTVFSKADLSEATLAQVRFHKAVGAEAKLERAKLQSAELVECVFANCHAKEAVFDGATLTKTSFFGATLAAASFLEAKGEGTSWIEADLTGAELSHAHLPQGIFNEARASKARFYGANLKQGRFYRTVLERADLTRANLYEANFTRASLDYAKFVESNLFDARLIQVTSTGADFERANLKKAMVEADDARS